MQSLANRNQKSDRFLVERFSQWIPGWGKKQLTLDDLGNLCDECGIVVVEMPLEGDGYAFWIGAQAYIYINSLMNYAERVITGFHELAHILYHPPAPEVFRRQQRCCWNFSKADRQAEIVGVVAWMPRLRIADRGLRIEDVMSEFGVRRETAEFRASLDLWQLTTDHHPVTDL